MSKPKDDFTDTQIKEYNRKFERGSTSREDLRDYTLSVSDDSSGASSEADKKMNKLDRDSSLDFVSKVHFLANRLS